MSQNGQFERYQIVRVDLWISWISQHVHDNFDKMEYPVLCRLSDKGTLVATRTRVSLYGVTPCADEIVQF